MGRLSQKNKYKPERAVACIEGMRLLSVKQVAEIINIKPSTIYAWAELGKIPHVKLNGTLRFRLEDIQSWIEGNQKSCANSIVCKSIPPFFIQKGSKRRYNRLVRSGAQERREQINCGPLYEK